MKIGLLDIVDVNGKNRVTLRSVIELATGMRNAPRKIEQVDAWLTM